MTLMKNTIVDGIFAFVWLNHICVAYFTPMGQKASSVQCEKDLGWKCGQRKSNYYCGSKTFLWYLPSVSVNVACNFQRNH